MAPTTKRSGMVSVVLDYLKAGNEITAIEAAQMWGELNLRNKISALRTDGWPIHSRQEKSVRSGAIYKVYFLDGHKNA